MSPHTFAGLLSGFVAWSGFMYYEGHSNEETKCRAEDSAATVVAYQHKDEVTAQHTAITQSEVTSYEKDSSAIGALYPDSVPASPVVNLPNVPATAIRTRPTRSKLYKFTFKQCDIEEAKLKSLYDRDMKLSDVK